MLYHLFIQALQKLAGRLKLQLQQVLLGVDGSFAILYTRETGGATSLGMSLLDLILFVTCSYPLPMQCGLNTAHKELSRELVGGDSGQQLLGTCSNIDSNPWHQYHVSATTWGHCFSCKAPGDQQQTHSSLPGVMAHYWLVCKVFCFALQEPRWWRYSS